MSSIVKEHQANGVSLYKAACEKEMITSCFHYLNEKLKIYLSLPASMNAAASKIMADIYFRKNNLLKSINIIDLSLKNCSNPFICTSLNIKKAFYLIKQGDVDKANTLLSELKNEKDIEQFRNLESNKLIEE